MCNDLNKTSHDNFDYLKIKTLITEFLASNKMGGKNDDHSYHVKLNKERKEEKTKENAWELIWGL